MKCIHLMQLRCLHAATVVVFAYLCYGELLPLPAIKASKVLQAWAVQQVVLLGLLSCLIVLLASVAGTTGIYFATASGRPMSATALLNVLNVLPVAAAIATTHWNALSDNCPVDPDKDCDYLAIVLDTVGLITARLSRLDLGISLLLAARGESSWLLGATGGWLGYAEAVPLHRTAGWWCVWQSALHSIAYVLFYFETGGLASLWRDCLPTRLPNSTALHPRLNRLGLVNFLGFLPFVIALALALSAWRPVRKRYYHVFQKLHLPLGALFVVCCALHDLPILIFALPSIAAWYLEWHARRHHGSSSSSSSSSSLLQRGGERTPHGGVLPAQLTLLPGTSGPWLELTVVSGEGSAGSVLAAPRGAWVSMRVVPLGAESHPLSVASAAFSGRSTTKAQEELSVLISSGSGDWTLALAALLAQQPAGSSRRLDVEIDGPYPFGGGDWSLRAGEKTTPSGGGATALLLLAGGTGVTGWLPALAAGGGTVRRCRLVWCVQTAADYRALAKRLPYKGAVEVTVYVTRAAADAAPPTPWRPALGEGREQSERDEATRWQPLNCDGSSPSSGVAVSLAAALVGLVVGHWGWHYLVELLGLSKIPEEGVPAGWLHTTLIGYMLSRRCLPIVVITLAVVASTALCRRALAYARACTRGRCRACPRDGSTRDAELGAVSPPQPDARLFTGATSSSTVHVDLDVPMRDDERSAGGARPAATEDAGAGGHVMRTGRPDVEALVRAAAADAGPARRLVVAACGPVTLVAAARKAVVAARKDSRGVRIEFSGGESWW